MKVEKIAVGTDFSELSDLAVKTAFSLGRRFGAAVHLLHAVDERLVRSGYPYAQMTGLEPLLQDEKAFAEKRLESLREVDLVTEREVRIGIPARELSVASAEAEADLLVVASHGYGPVQRALWGSVAASLIRTSATPVLVVGQGRSSLEMKTVVAGVDLSPVSAAVLGHAVTLTRPGGHLEIITAYEPPLFAASAGRGVLASQEEIRASQVAREEEVKRRLPPAAEITVSVEALAKAPASMAILESAELLNADLVVVGTSGHNAWHRAFVGSTANRVLALAECPVLVVPASVSSD